MARHEALRASFSWNSGEAMLQIIHKPGNLAVDYQDWRGLADEAQEQRLQALHKQEREAGFACSAKHRSTCAWCVWPTSATGS